MTGYKTCIFTGAVLFILMPSVIWGGVAVPWTSESYNVYQHAEVNFNPPDIKDTTVSNASELPISGTANASATLADSSANSYFNDLPSGHEMGVNAFTNSNGPDTGTNGYALASSTLDNFFIADGPLLEFSYTYDANIHVENSDNTGNTLTYQWLNIGVEIREIGNPFNTQSLALVDNVFEILDAFGTISYNLSDSDTAYFSLTEGKSYRVLVSLDTDAIAGGTATAGAPSTLTFDMAVVPLPGAVWLFGSGLIGIVGIRRKFKK